MPSEPTPFQRRNIAKMVDVLGIENPDTSGPERLTHAERILYNDSHTSSTTVYDASCYICTDPDFARMGLPLCWECEECKKAGRGLGHVAADDVECTVCGWDSYAVYMEEQENEANSGNA
jgi:hypothetical protein